MSYLTKPVIYLEPKDFTSLGNLKHFKDKICVIMVQANYCGYCNDAKPSFQKFAENNKNIVCLTIQGDDEKNSNSLSKIIQKIKPSFQGFPDYILCKKGKYIE